MAIGTTLEEKGKSRLGRIIIVGCVTLRNVALRPVNKRILQKCPYQYAYEYCYSCTRTRRTVALLLVKHKHGLISYRLVSI